MLSLTPRAPRPRTSSRGNRRAGPGNRAGSRRGPEAAKEEAAPGARYGGGAGLLAALQPAPNFSRPAFDSFPPRRTPELQSWRRLPRARPPARPDHPRGAPTSARPSGSRARRACALPPPTAAPPSSCPDSRRPASALGGHVDPGRGGGRAACASHLPGVVTPEEFASRSPSVRARALRALSPQCRPAGGL